VADAFRYRIDLAGRVEEKQTMDISGEYRIAASREAVWHALNDPEILKQCIPGCEELDKISDTEFAGKITAKVGPVKAKFAGKVKLSDLDPPNGYKISGEGSGGAAGFAKGGADVHLTDDGAGTLLAYKVDAQIGGKLAQIGSRLIEGTVRKTADDFFAKFTEVVGHSSAVAPAIVEAVPDAASVETPADATLDPPPGPETPVLQTSVPMAAVPPAAASAPGPRPAPPAADQRRLSPFVWVGGLAVIVIILLYIFSQRGG
jgi:carbon monoxide dehydrogenase subunit G